MKISSYITDETKEMDGVWRNLKGGGRVLVARYRNPKYNALLRELLQPMVKGLAADKELDPDQFQDVVLQASSEAILLDWSDIQGNDGVDIVYTPEIGLYYLRESRDFREEVLSFSQQRAAYARDFVEHATGN